jgi:hypothetical protein
MAMIEWESEAGSVHIVRFFSLYSHFRFVSQQQTCWNLLCMTGQKLFVVDRFVAGLITSLLQTWQEQFATGLLEQVVTYLLISTDFLQVVLSDLLSLVSKRFVAGCFNKSLRLCCQQLATDLFKQTCYRLTKPTDLSWLVDNLPQAGKMNNLRQACEISACVDVSEVSGSVITQAANNIKLNIFVFQGSFFLTFLGSRWDTWIVKCFLDLHYYPLSYILLIFSTIKVYYAWNM